MSAGFASASTTYFVATTGNDTTGTGTSGNPYATITKALTAVANGDTISVANGSYSPTTVWSITKSITIQAQNIGGATLNAVASQASIINVAFTAGGTFTLSGFVLDGTNSTIEIIRLVNEPTTYTFNSTNNTYQNIPQYGILGSSSTDKAILVSTGDTFTDSSITTAIYRPTVSAGSTTITNDTFNVTASIASNGLAWSIKANAAGTTFSSSGNTITATTTYTAGENYGMSIYNTTGTSTADTITMNSTVSSSCTPILATQVAGAPLASSGAILNASTTNNCAGGGHGITIGTDGDPGSSNRNFTNNWVVSGSHLSASAAAQSSGVHGILFGWENGGTAYGNYASGLGYTWLSKGMAGTTLYYGNIDVSTAFASQDMKGSQSGGCTSYINNTSYAINGTAVGNRTEVEPATGFLPTLCALENNIFYGGFGQFVQWVQGSTLPTTIATNDYFATSTIASNAWSYYVGSTQTNIGTLAGWQSAQESTALSTDPVFVSALTNLRTSSGSALNSAGTSNASAPNDYGGTPFSSVRSVGAYQYIDSAVPTVSLTAPSSSATVSGSVSLSASASDDGGVAGVQFKLDTNTSIGSEDTSAPYAATWDSTGVADGTHTIIAVARDYAGNYATSAVATIAVDNTAPVRLAGAPSGTLALNTTSTTLSLTTNEAATCRYSTSSGTAYGSMTAFATTGGTSHSAAISGLSNGSSYIYYVKCQDAQGNTNATDYTISFTIAADTTSPTVSVTAPSNNTVVSGNAVAVSANASDDVSVAGVRFKLDTNTSIGSEDTSAPYALTWDSTGVAGGTHTIIAVARDGAGNYATSSVITITVSNASPVSTPAAPSGGPIFVGSAASLPGYIAPRSQVVYPDGRVVYTDASEAVSAPAPIPTTLAPTEKFTRTLQLRSSGEDVRALQVFLNTHGFTVAKTGPGSLGYETTYFGLQTKAALIAYQEANAAVIIAPNGLTHGTGYFGPSTRALMNMQQ